MNPERVESVVDSMEAHELLTRCVSRMTAAWERPGAMAELVDQARQHLTVLLHNAEFLAAQHQGHDCPDCKGRGSVPLPATTYSPQKCETCNGKGYL